MSARALIIALAVGALAGWLAGLLTKRRGFGLLGNVIVGIAGALIARFGFGLLGIVATTFLGQFIFAVVGALVFVYLLRFIER